MLEHNPVSTLRVPPRNRAGLVAQHVAGAAFEALLVVEQDAAIIGGNKKFGWARMNTRLSRAASTNFAIDSDVRCV